MAILRSTVSLVLLVAFLAINQTLASSESEIFYIEKILGLLNNKEKCQMPTYAEIDDLQTSFNELKSLWGAEFDAKLTADQKLVLDTVLEQWGSFQQYLTRETVTKTAKKRAFLGKVEKYQEGKHGFSICTQQPDDREQPADSEYEKNPLVRYVKQVQTDGPAVDAPKPDNEEKANTDAVPNNAANDDKAVGPRGGPNGNDPFADEPDVTFKFKVHPKDGEDGNVRQYGGKFTYRNGRNPHRITLNINRK